MTFFGPGREGRHLLEERPSLGCPRMPRLGVIAAPRRRGASHRGVGRGLRARSVVLDARAGGQHGSQDERNPRAARKYVPLPYFGWLLRATLGGRRSSAPRLICDGTWPARAKAAGRQDFGRGSLCSVKARSRALVSLRIPRPLATAPKAQSHPFRVRLTEAQEAAGALGCPLFLSGCIPP